MDNLNTLLLSAGLGTRLQPFTSYWPKCLMPIRKTPLLEYWLSSLRKLDIRNVYVNSHHHSSEVNLFLKRKRFSEWVTNLYEKKLLGTAGTIRENRNIFYNRPLFLIHTDNWSAMSIKKFLTHSAQIKNLDCVMSMVTFFTGAPKDCGIVTLDKFKIITDFHEKDPESVSNIANGAVYFLDKIVVNWICDNPDVNDFSKDVIPFFLGRIASWHNNGYHRDIGFIESLSKAQSDPRVELYWKNDDKWITKFRENIIHNKLNLKYEC